ncbi:hypothetical protein Tco_0364204 [Tanacetum coccineum]
MTSLVTLRWFRNSPCCAPKWFRGGRSVEKLIGGLPDNVQGNVIAAEPTKGLQDAVRIDNTCDKIERFAVRNGRE